ncbi:NAD(P)-dependent alcohol dehydrogenase [Kibdelosporangium aridum]|uniref:Aryl-alcohol dehydrogenase n=1 Tax=Kibdelosporangium aridum TaxID=2030 RepID=A0A1W2FWZ0_KIBAR|nr:NAD(P)-dependent alcohol dehydrogenase [Kibdelosporangium aridum]SMD26383.1 aryl-alcohol dehydrogenase [Kibdelosporangium aridum]
MRITAAVLRAQDGPYHLEEVDLAEPGLDEILVRVVGTGLCHSDLLPRTPGFPATPPIITGHEGAGVVEVVGERVTGLVPGDHVVLSFDSCRQCGRCHTGHPAYCDTFFPRNLSGTSVTGDTSVRDASGAPVASRWFGQSSFATHCLASSRNAVKVDPRLPLELLGPLGCSVQTGAASVFVALGVEAGASVVVFGAGGVGLSAVMAAKVAGATTIVAVDLAQNRLALAEELGATHTFDGALPDLAEQLIRVTGGVEYTVDTTGVPSVITTAVSVLQPGGTCGVLGVQQGDLVLPPTALGVGRNIMGIIEGDAVPQTCIPPLIELWRQGRFPFDKLIRTFPLDQINEAEKASLSGDVVKPVLMPGDHR